MNPEDIRWDYLSQFDYLIWLGCAIAITALGFVFAKIRAQADTIVRMQHVLEGKGITYDTMMSFRDHMQKLFEAKRVKPIQVPGCEYCDDDVCVCKKEK